MNTIKVAILAGVSLAALGAVSAVPVLAQSASHLESALDDSGTMRRVDKDELRVLEKLVALGAKPLGTLSVDETRKAPSVADAVKGVLEDDGKDPLAPVAAMRVKTVDLTYPTGGGTQPVRVYTPEGLRGPLPVIVFYHGGGWVLADIGAYAASATALARKADAIVVSVEYRHAPENKFPAAHDDAFNAYKWVLANAPQWSGDPGRVAVAGESAGGNLALNVAIMARDAKVRAPLHVLAIYPVAGTDLTTPSYVKNEHALPLSRPAMEWFFANTVKDGADKGDPRLNLVKADLKALPPTTILTAEIDPLMSDGQALADAMKAAGDTVTYRNYEGVTHEFFGTAAVVRKAEQAQDFAAERLQAALLKE